MQRLRFVLVASAVALALCALAASAAAAKRGPLVLSTEEAGSGLAGIGVHAFGTIKLDFKLGKQHVICEDSRPEALRFTGSIVSEGASDVMSVEPSTSAEGFASCGEGGELETVVYQDNPLWQLTISNRGKAEVTAGSGEPLEMRLQIVRSTGELLCVFRSARLIGINPASPEPQELTLAFSPQRPANLLRLKRASSTRGCPMALGFGFRSESVELGGLEAGNQHIFEQYH